MPESIPVPAELQRANVTLLVDAMSATGLDPRKLTMRPDIRPLSLAEGRTVIGRALTTRWEVGRGRMTAESVDRYIFGPLDAAPPDSVWLVAGGSEELYSLFGDIIMMACQRNGMAGAVTDNGCASAGYKPGGSVLDTDTRYEDERLWNYEAGIKMQAMDNRLTINAAVFHMIWDGLQIPTLDTEIVNGMIELNTEILNIDATSSGAELEVQVLPIDQLFLAAGIGFLKAEFDGFGADDPYLFEGMAFDIDGKTLPRSPEWTLNLVGQYNSPLTADYEGFVRLEWSYRAETFSDIEALAAVTEPLDIPGFGNSVSGVGINIPFPRADFPFRVPSFDIVNLRAGIESERWSLVAYVENLLDDNYYTGTQENFGLGGIRIRPHHRISGVEFRFFSE